MHLNNKGTTLPFIIIISAIVMSAIVSMGAILQHSSRFSHVYHRDVASLYIAKNYAIAGVVDPADFSLDFEVDSERISSANQKVTVYFPNKAKAEYKRSYMVK